MQRPFFEHLSVLASEYERLVDENEQLRSRLNVYSDYDHGGCAETNSVNETGSTETCRLSKRQHCQDGAPLHIVDMEQQSLLNMLTIANPGGEPDQKASPRAPRLMSRQHVHNAAPASDQSKDPVSEEMALPELTATYTGVSDPSPQFQLQKSLSNIRDGPYTGVSDIKDKIKSELLKEDARKDVTQYYKKHGLMQRIARHPFFDHLTLSIIGVYAVWMAVDADWNSGDSILNTPWVFIIAEQLFCVYFTAELIIRFGAFQRKANCVKDAWFVFDSVLVLMMIAETWILNGIVFFSQSSSGGASVGNTSLLRMARLMRLTRLLRMARLVRMVPELFIMIKAIAAAARTVGFTLALLLIILYVFGIGFKGLLTDTYAGEKLFSSVLFSMHSLLVHATFLDNLTDVMLVILADSYLAFAMMYVCISMSAITVMNMLIGVLCEVISAVAAAENEVIQVRWVKETLLELLGMGDSDTDGCIDHQEFLTMLQNPRAVEALNGIEIDAIMLVDSEDLIFPEGQAKLPFSDFMEALLQLRGSNTATVKDLVDMRKVLASQIKSSQATLQEILSAVNGHLVNAPVPI